MVPSSRSCAHTAGERAQRLSVAGRRTKEKIDVFMRTTCPLSTAVPKPKFLPPNPCKIKVPESKGEDTCFSLAQRLPPGMWSLQMLNLQTDRKEGRVTGSSSG
ncbi:hypothetical protein AAFF_G00271260 [Aldrovandia affinis]|uniref:Uncharacterized protein n=1 Tax=Aldrovandia affinis TaxID=143900 RepID=A0AAD7RAX5_9TELE|nr:hypothetical protein AAFF_G00271260 [Aldrovandia affinis]